MAAKQLKASIIIDMTGNVMNKAGQFGSAIDRMVKRNSASLKTLRNDVKYLSDSFDKFGTRAVMGVTAAGVAIDKTFVKTAAMFERYQIQSAQLFGGDKGGRKALNWAKQNAKATTMSLQEVMQMMAEMKGFGLDPMGGKLKIMEDEGAMRGWKSDETHAALLQLEQMYAKSKITMEDATPLLEKGLDVYGYLSKYSGISEKQVRALGDKGLLGKKALDIVFQGMAKESNGASEKAMKSFDNMVSNLGDDWTQWQENVMNRGVFDKVKNKVRQFKNLIEDPDKANQAAHNTAAILNHSIDMATAGAEGLWDVFKGIGTTIDKTSTVLGDWAVKLGIADDKAKSADKSLVGIKYLVEGIAAVWLGNKAVSMGLPFAKAGWLLGKGGWKTSKGLYKAGRWGFRKIFRRGRPEMGNEIPGVSPDSIPGVGTPDMRVFVTNWPRPRPGRDYGGGDFGDTESKKGRRKKGPGKGRSKMSRIFGAGEEVLEDVEHVSGSGGTWGRVKSLFGGAGRAAKAVPLLGAAVAAVDVVSADNNTERGGALGGSVGAWVGGALGTLTDEFTGPFGTIVGAEIGQSLGDKLGSMIGSLFDDKKDDKTAQQNPLNGRIDLNLNLPAGMGLTSSMMSFGGDNPFDLNTGGYIP